MSRITAGKSAIRNNRQPDPELEKLRKRQAQLLAMSTTLEGGRYGTYAAYGAGTADLTTTVIEGEALKSASAGAIATAMAAGALAPTPAAAQCVNTSGDVVCTGSVAGPVSYSGAGYTLDNQGTVTLNEAGSAISLTGTNTYAINEGSIYSGADESTVGANPLGLLVGGNGADATAVNAGLIVIDPIEGGTAFADTGGAAIAAFTETGTATATSQSGAQTYNFAVDSDNIIASGDNAYASNDGLAFNYGGGTGETPAGVPNASVISANAEGGYALADNTGTARAFRAYTSVVGAYAFGESSTASAVNEAGGDVDNLGANGVGVGAVNDGGLLASAVNNGDVNTTGDFTPGVAASGLEGANAYAANTSSESVSAAGEGAYGVVAYASGGGTATAVNSGDISTQGQNAAALATFATGGDAVATNSGEATTTNNDAHAVYAQAVNGNATATNTATGVASTEGGSAHGVYAQVTGEGSQAVANNSGSVTTTGDYAFGAYAIAQDLDGDATVMNLAGGSIMTSGDGSAGVIARAYYGSAYVNNAGDISTTATSGYEADGVIVDAYGNEDSYGAASFINTGTISTIDGEAVDINGSATGDTAFSNSGDITVTGSGSPDAVNIYSRAGNLNFYNSGLISTVGDSAEVVEIDTYGYGSYVGELSSTITFMNAATGVITGSGVESAEVVDIDVGGNGPYGVVTTLDFTNAGMIQASGDTSEAVDLDLNQAATHSVNNTGTISTSGANAEALVLDSNFYASGSVINVDNDGMIQSLGTGSGALEADLYQASLDLDNSGTISSADSYAIEVSGEGAPGSTVEITNTGTITGDSTFEGTTDTFIHSGIINGDVDLGGGDDAFTVQGAGAQINSTISGGEGTDTFTSNPSGTFSFGGAGGPHIITGFETIDFAGGTTIFDGVAINGSPMTVVEAGATWSLQGADTTQMGGSVTNNGALAVAPGTALNIIEGGFTATSGSTTQFGASDAGFGQIIADGNIDFQSGSTVAIDVVGTPVALLDGQTFNAVVSNSGMVTDGSGVTVVDNSFLFDFSKAVIGGNALQISIEQALVLSQAANPDDPNRVAAATALQDLLGDDGPGAGAIGTALGVFATAPELDAALEDFVPDESNGLVIAAISGYDRVIGLLNNRLNQGDLYDASGALDAGSSGFWVEGFGAWDDFNTDDDDFRVGFESNLYGVAAGYDYAFTPSLLAGLTYYYIDGDVDESGANGAETDVSTHGILAYASKRFGDYRSKTSIGYGWNDYQGWRPIPVLDETASAEFDGSQFTFATELGYGLQHGDYTFTPLIGIRYVNLDFDAYEETGSVGAVAFDERDVDSLRGEIGLIASYDGAWGGYSYAPEAHVRVFNEFLDIDEPLAGRFVGGGSDFTTLVASPDDFSVNLGASISLLNKGAFDMRAGYDVTLGDGFTNHGFAITGRLNF
ncbi:MAG: autotransporter domain-containing protein [Pseudomonadota bacterium]